MQIAPNLCGLSNFQGCKEKLKTLLKDALYVVGAIGVTIVVIQVRSNNGFSLQHQCTAKKTGLENNESDQVGEIILIYMYMCTTKISKLSLKSMCGNNSVTSPCVKLVI